MLVCHLQVVLGGDALAVAEPGTHDVDGILFGQLRLAADADLTRHGHDRGESRERQRDENDKGESNLEKGEP